MDDPQNITAKLAARLSQLPKVVQDAILSADVEKHMRDLAEQHKLHFDQWTALENEVMFTLLGFQPIQDLQRNIEREVGVSPDVSKPLAEDISQIVFAPIRAQLEASLKAQEARAAAMPLPPTAPVPTVPKAPVVGTPPPPPPQEKTVRAPISQTYTAGTASQARATVAGDPYREQNTP